MVNALTKDLKPGMGSCSGMFRTCLKEEEGDTGSTPFAAVSHPTAL